MKPLVLGLLRLLARTCGAAALAFVAAEGALRLGGLPTGGTRSIRDAYDVTETAVGAFQPGSAVRVTWPPETAYAARFNALGCRGDAPRAVDAPAIVCVGDSLTFGMGLADEDAYPAQLDRRLAAAGTPRPVVNLASGHLHIEDSREYLDRALARLDVGVVALLAPCDGYLDPPGPAGETQHRRSKRREAERRGGVAGFVHDLALYEARTMARLWRERASLVGRGQFPPDFQAAGAAPEAERAALRARYLEQARLLADAVRERGARLVLAAWPEVRVAGGVPSFHPPWSAAAAAALGVPYVDLQAALARAPDPAGLLQLPVDLHPSPRGAAVIAAEVHRTLAREGLLGPP